MSITVDILKEYIEDLLTYFRPFNCLEHLFLEEFTQNSWQYHYFNNLTIENNIYRYVVKDDYLYTYGLSGYTKIKLGVGIHIIKVLNVEYEKNYIANVEGRGTFYSSIEELRYGYLDDITLLRSFEDMDDEDLNTFYLLFKKLNNIEEYLLPIEKSHLYYKDGKKVAQGLRELNDSLIKEYMKRNGKWEINNTSK